VHLIQQHFFDVNALAPEPAVNYWGSDGSNGPMTLGSAFAAEGSSATTITGSGRGIQAGIYAQGGIFAFTNQSYLLTHELSHVVQGQNGASGNLDQSLAKAIGLPATPDTASQVLSDFFNSECKGFK
jgi:hypothetical protein